MSFPRIDTKFSGYMNFAGILVYGDKVYNVPLTVTDLEIIYTITENVTDGTIYNVSGLTPPI